MTAEKKVKKVRIQLVHSAIARSKRQKETIKGLGLTKLQKIVELNDTPPIRGMINKVPHLVKVLDD